MSAKFLEHCSLLPLSYRRSARVQEPDLGATLFLTTGFPDGPLRRWLAAQIHVLAELLAAVPVAMSLLILKPNQVRRITGFMAAWQSLRVRHHGSWKVASLTRCRGGLHEPASEAAGRNSATCPKPIRTLSFPSSEKSWDCGHHHNHRDVDGIYSTGQRLSDISTATRSNGSSVRLCCCKWSFRRSTMLLLSPP